MDPKCIIYVLSLAPLLSVVVKSLEYNDLETLGITCPREVSCAEINNSDFSLRNCECDRNCVYYNDCCVDAITRRLSPGMRNVRISCVPFGDEPNVGVYAIKTCSESYSGSDEIRTKCQGSNNISDILMAAPVTDTINSLTYRNSYCAECNGIGLENLEIWLVRIHCKAANINNNNSIYQNLIYRQDLNSWGVNLNQEFHRCDLLFHKPEYLDNSTRLCRANIISSCPSSYTRLTVIENCESYTAVMYTKGETMYKNPHCAICHGLSIDDLRCYEGIDSRRKDAFSFTKLFDFNGTNNCRSDQKYDPVAKKCRNIVCALPGYIKVNGKCVKS